MTYGLQTACPNLAERRRIDGLQARCLRRILRIPHAYYSRVSNRTVLERAGHRPITESLLREQMIYMGQLARRRDDDPARQCVFVPGGVALRALPGPRRRGRPRLCWTKCVHEACLRVAGSEDNLKEYFQRSEVAERAWRVALQHFYT